MQWGRDWSATGASARIVLLLSIGLVAAGCNTTGPHANASLGAARGATVAFDSIDGPPRDVFDRLVKDLNTEAQRRQLAVVSRDSTSAYRVRGYLVAASAAKHSALNWIWDVYDERRQRVLRITGEQIIKGTHRDPWQALDGPAVEQIARESMDQLAAFLISPHSDPSTNTPVAYQSSPEAAGIFRIFPGSAVAVQDAPDQPPHEAADVPLPPNRPRLARAGTVALAIAPDN